MLIKKNVRKELISKSPKVSKFKRDFVFSLNIFIIILYEMFTRRSLHNSREMFTSEDTVFLAKQLQRSLDRFQGEYPIFQSNMNTQDIYRYVLYDPIRE